MNPPVPEDGQRSRSMWWLELQCALLPGRTGKLEVTHAQRFSFCIWGWWWSHPMSPPQWDLKGTHRNVKMKYLQMKRSRFLPQPLGATAEAHMANSMQQDCAFYGRNCRLSNGQTGYWMGFCHESELGKGKNLIGIIPVLKVHIILVARVCVYVNKCCTLKQH